MTKSKKKNPRPRVNLLQVLEDMEDLLPPTPEERETIFKESGVTQARVDESLRQTMALVHAELAKREAAAAARGIAAAQTPPSPKIAEAIERRQVRRSRDENLALIRALLARAPAGAPQLAFHRDFAAATDEDLDLLVAELEHLADTK